MRVVCCTLDRLSVVDFGHSANTSAAKSRVLVGISPAVDCSLNQATLATKTRVKLGQGPSNCVAL